MFQIHRCHSCGDLASEGPFGVDTYACSRHIPVDPEVVDFAQWVEDAIDWVFSGAPCTVHEPRLK